MTLDRVMTSRGAWGRRLTLADFIQALTGWSLDSPDVPVVPVIDSREAQPGSIFFAFAGEHVDGHAYVNDALARGSVAAVVQNDVSVPEAVDILDLREQDSGPRPVRIPVVVRVNNVLEAMQDAARWWRQQLAVRIIGVTGSVGKTTTKEVAAKVLEQRYHVVRSQRSFNNELGLPLTLLSLGAPTGADVPESERLRVVLEMGMYVPGDIRFLCDIARPHVGIVTNVEAVHAEHAGTLDDIARAKRELVEALPTDGVAILNQDDARVRAMAGHTRAVVFTYGLSPEADLWADDVEGLGLQGIRGRLHYRDEVVTFEAPLLGRHSIYAVLRGAAAGLVEGLTWDEIVEGLAAPGLQLRLVTVRGPYGCLIIDDTFNSSPPSAVAALGLLADLEGRKVAVLGDMLELGAYERDGHLEVGLRAAEVVEELVVVGARAQMIAEGASERGLPADHIRSAPDSDAAVDIVRDLLRPGDVVLIKGSHAVQMERIVRVLTEAV